MSEYSFTEEQFAYLLWTRAVISTSLLLQVILCNVCDWNNQIDGAVSGSAALVTYICVNCEECSEWSVMYKLLDGG